LETTTGGIGCRSRPTHIRVPKFGVERPRMCLQVVHTHAADGCVGVARCADRQGGTRRSPPGGGRGVHSGARSRARARACAAWRGHEGAGHLRGCGTDRVVHPRTRRRGAQSVEAARHLPRYHRGHHHHGPLPSPLPAARVCMYIPPRLHHLLHTADVCVCAPDVVRLPLSHSLCRWAPPRCWAWAWPW
jgi:hypothetical protein